ncbi:MAG: DUF1295 domain-containing protein [Acholeplasmatales bacterium]|nr:DUF1295 domain-containing protein [Acholeplasmatales bacterium]
MRKIKENRIASFIVILLVYAIAITVGIITYNLLEFDFWLNLLLADIVSTAITFIFSLIFNNSSVYDPYWSVIPIVVVIGYSIKFGINNINIFILIAVLLWGTRLTINWAYTFTNLYHEDWRYRMYKEKFPKLYPLVNFFGIHLFPTIVVYLCMLPIAFIFNKAEDFSYLIIIGFIISILAFLLQLISDVEMHKFRKKKLHKLIDVGLWKYSRHPNYLGEISMWWGVYFMMLAVLPNYWFLFIGALVNNLMFLFISIPMADKRQSEKEGYAEYKSRTRMLLPIYKKQKNL